MRTPPTPQPTEFSESLTDFFIPTNRWVVAGLWVRVWHFKVFLLFLPSLSFLFTFLFAHELSLIFISGNIFSVLIGMSIPTLLCVLSTLRLFLSPFSLSLSLCSYLATSSWLLSCIFFLQCFALFLSTIFKPIFLHSLSFHFFVISLFCHVTAALLYCYNCSFSFVLCFSSLFCYVD